MTLYMTWSNTESRERIFTTTEFSQCYSNFRRINYKLQRKLNHKRNFRSVMVRFFYMTWPKTESRERIFKTVQHKKNWIIHICYSQFFYMTWPEKWIARTSFRSCPLRFFYNNLQKKHVILPKKMNRENEFPQLST